MKKIIIVDYGLGNIHSAEQSLKKIVEEKNYPANVLVINNSKEINSATHIVLPGQGAFASCINGLKNMPGMIDELSENVLIKRKPFLGICVGMQLLATTGYENGYHSGLGWVNGDIKKMPNVNLKLPHMGWNEITINKKNDLVREERNKDFYFVHSYFFDCESKENEVATTNYGINFPSIVSKENIFGVQFHPEKSSIQGLNLLENFINL